MKKSISFSKSSVLHTHTPNLRSRVMLFVLFLAFIALFIKAFFLQGVSNAFYQKQGEVRYARTLEMPASRGKITDRNGVVVASSVPAKAIWAIPEDVKVTPAQVKALAKLLEMPEDTIQRRLSNEDKSFVYLKRQVPVEVAEQVKALAIAGVHEEKEVRRYYPEAEVVAHILGFTNIEDKGQEGIELAYNKELSGVPGSRRVIKDRLGRVVEDVKFIRNPSNGHDLALAIDTRVQYLAYSHLKAAVDEHHAKGGAAIVVDTHTGEILALVNLPTYDPNNRVGLTGAQLRNRALTDTFEPGSTMKPVTVATALDLGRIKPTTIFETGNGRYQFSGSTITDVSANGTLDLTGVLRKSSNIGMTMISQRLEAKEMWEKFNSLGLGSAPRLDFPGAVAGRLRPWERWKPIEKATMAYGYGLSVSLIQMAQVYTAFARNGDVIPLTFMKRNTAPPSTQIYKPETVQALRGMLEQAAGPDGSGRAQVNGYRVAGKSGTARKIVNGAYSHSKYTASFVGLAPVSNPRVVVAIMLDEPSEGGYYGGRVAAPVFSQVVGGTLRLMQVPPDAPFQSLVMETVTRKERNL